MSVPAFLLFSPLRLHFLVLFDSGSRRLPRGLLLSFVSAPPHDGHRRDVHRRRRELLHQGLRDPQAMRQLPAFTHEMFYCEVLFSPML